MDKMLKLSLSTTHIFIYFVGVVDSCKVVAFILLTSVQRKCWSMQIYAFSLWNFICVYLCEMADGPFVFITLRITS